MKTTTSTRMRVTTERFDMSGLSSSRTKSTLTTEAETMTSEARVDIEAESTSSSTMTTSVEGSATSITVGMMASKLPAARAARPAGTGG